MTEPADTPKIPALATASITLGCVGLICAMFLPFVMVVPAVICGHLAVRKIRNSNGALTGEGRATTGLVTGYIGMVASVIGLIILSVAIPGFRRASTDMAVEAAIDNARILAAASLNYARANDNRLPNELGDLEAYVQSTNVFDSPLEDEEDGKADYVFLMPGKSLLELSHPDVEIILRDVHTAYEGGQVVGYADGRSALVRKGL